jgi:O-antigen/teichoic acid export membrane protein
MLGPASCLCDRAQCGHEICVGEANLSLSLNIIAQRLLPARFYQRLAASDVAKRLAYGSAWSVFGSAISRLLVLAGMILLARILGKTEFGEFGMVQATLGVAGMMAGFGLGSTATRFVAHYSKTDPARAGRIIALVTVFSWGLILVVGMTTALGAGHIAREMLHAGHLQTALIWGTLLMVVMAIRGVQSGVLAGVERFDVIAKLNVLEGIASLVGLVSLAWLFGVEGGLLGLALGILATWVVGRFDLQRTLRNLNISVTPKGCWKEKGILAGYSFPNFLANLVATPVLWYCMTLIAKRPDGYEDLALYNAAYQWHGPLIFLPMILLSVSTPVLVQQWEQGSFQRFRKVFLWNAGFTLAISAIPVLLIGLLSRWIMGLYGDGFSEGWLFLILLASAAPMHAMAKMASTALLGMNRAWSVFGLNLIWGATLLTFTLFLTPPWGATGLAIAFLLAYCILMLSTTALVFWHLHDTKQHSLVNQAHNL